MPTVLDIDATWLAGACLPSELLYDWNVLPPRLRGSHLEHMNSAVQTLLVTTFRPILLTGHILLAAASLLSSG